MRREHSKSYNKQFVQTAVHLNSYSTLCLCCIFKAIREGCTQIRQIGNIRNFEISCIISYQYLWIVQVYIHICTWVRARVKRTIPSSVRLALLLPVLSACPFRFYRLTRLSGFLAVIFSWNRIILSSRTRFLWTCLYDIILHKIPNIT